MAKRRRATPVAGTKQTRGAKQTRSAKPAGSVKPAGRAKRAKSSTRAIRARPRVTAAARSVEESMQLEGLFSNAGSTGNTTDARPSFEQFFQQVADGVVKAQRSLDTVSAKYVEDARRQPHVLPSVFRIPKVSAEAKFALESTDGTTVNLVFFKKTEEAKTRHQQSVQFDVMAVPPPPELHALPFQLPLVVDAALRAAVVGTLDPKDWPHPDAVLILNLSPDDYLLVYAGPNAGQVAIRHVRLAAGASPTDVVLRPLGAPAESLKPLSDMLTKLGQVQRGFLARR